MSELSPDVIRREKVGDSFVALGHLEAQIERH
jgi:hypothetical protein